MLSAGLGIHQQLAYGCCLCACLLAVRRIGTCTLVLSENTHTILAYQVELR